MQNTGETKYLPTQQELSRQILELQRFLVLKVIVWLAKWDQLRGRQPILPDFATRNSSAEHLREQWACTQHWRKRWLVRWALWVYRKLEKARGAREFALTTYLWTRAIAWYIKPSLRQSGYLDWIAQFEKASLPTQLPVATVEGKPSAFARQLLASSGDYFVCVSGSVRLSAHALGSIQQACLNAPDCELFYGDSDSLNWRGQRHSPRFHSDFSLEYMVGSDCFEGVTVWRRSALEKLTESDAQTWPEAILTTALSVRTGHIPHILFHRTKKRSRIERAQWQDAVQHVFPQAEMGLKKTLRLKWPLPAQPPLVSIIIPTRDRTDLLAPLMQDLLHGTQYPRLEIWIVDNQSVEPQTFECFKEWQKDERVRVLSYPYPFNYAAMNNLAAKEARGEVLAFLNNDLRVIHPDWLQEMLREISRPEVGIVGPKLLFANGFIQHAGVHLGIVPFAAHTHAHEHGSSSGYDNRLNFAQSLSAVTGACLITRKDVFEQAKGFDAENLAVSYNDVDFCLRVRTLGYKVIWTPYAKLYHLESASRPSDRAPAQLIRYEREIAFMRTKWEQWFQHDPAYNPNLTGNKNNFQLADRPKK